VVVPEIEKLKPLVAKQIFEQMKAAGIRGEKENLKKLHSEQVVKVVRFKQLFGHLQ